MSPLARAVLEKIAQQPRWVGELRRSFPVGERISPEAMRTVLRVLLHKGYVQRASGRWSVTAAGDQVLRESEG
jgi:DNA-binding HxlR family transcriptional regulator